VILPTATDLLRNIDVTLAEKVEPSLSDVTGRSALATVRHLLNFVRLRIEREGQQLHDDIAALRPLLEQAGDFFRASREDAPAVAIEQALAQITSPDPTRYRTLDDLALEANGLRRALHDALSHLQTLRPRLGANADYRGVRESIRHYITSQIEAEAELIEPAFFGRGPRR
jgi:hypothetical protein